MSILEPVIVIGGCGGLGHYIVKLLFEADVKQVTVFDIRDDHNTISGARYVKGSIDDKEAVFRLLKDSQARTVFHTASPSPLINQNNPGIFDRINISGTKILLNACLELGTTKAFIYTSSASVCHDNRTDLCNAKEDVPYCTRENQPVHYTYTKAEAEKLVLGANRSNGVMATVAIRACAIFGEGDNTIPANIANAKTFKGRLQVGDGKNMFDWTYNGNTAHAHLLAAKALSKVNVDEQPSCDPTAEASRVDGEAFVITNDDPWPFWKFIRAIGSAAGYPVKEEDVWIIPRWAFFAIAIIAEWSVWLLSLGKKQSTLNRETARFVTITRTFDIAKAKSRLGYRPTISIEEGIRRSVQAYQAQAGTKDVQKAN